MTGVVACMRDGTVWRGMAPCAMCVVEMEDFGGYMLEETDDSRAVDNGERQQWS